MPLKKRIAKENEIVDLLLTTFTEVDPIKSVFTEALKTLPEDAKIRLEQIRYQRSTLTGKTLTL